MTNLPINSLLAEPWAMEPARFAALVEDARAGRLEVRADSVKAEFAPPRTKAPQTVAVVPVVGPLMRAASPMEEMLAQLFGATTYGAIQAAVSEAASAGMPIILDINSPGGAVDGVAETADAIRAAAERVPVVAYVRGMGASAAYWLASSATKIVAARSARVGSIGVVATLMDDAGAQANEGVRRVQVVSSVSPAKRSEPMDSEVLARVQASVDDVAALFVEHVAAGRKTTADKVVADYGRGDVLIASKAHAAGMVDEVGGFAVAVGAALSSRKDQTMSAEIQQANEALAALGADTLTALGCANADEASGALVAAAQALAEIGPLRAEVAGLRAAHNRQELRATLTAGIAAGRLSLGDIATTIPSMLTDEARSDAMVKALEERAETTAAATLDAVCGVEVSAAEVKRIAGWAARKSPTFAAPVEPPARDMKGESAAAERLSEGAAEVSRIADEQRAMHVKNMSTRGTAATK